jgi:hypothetical protein
VSDIGVATSGRLHARVQALGERIRVWQADSGFDAVIWTDLAPNFDFDFSSADEHLAQLDGKRHAAALTYIGLAPGVVETPYRLHLRSIGVLPSGTSH